jgi:glutamate 5-kinase
MKTSSASILVIKLGTRILTHHTTNQLNESLAKDIVGQVSQLISRGYDVVIVSSGAIGAGMGVLGVTVRPQSLPELQACAAIGQGELMKLYSKLFKNHHHNVAQVLLTQDDLNSRQRYLNARNTLLTLLDKHVIPIINENDTVATDEIRFGDNDRLSSLVANLLDADRLIILTDVDNVYRYDGKHKEPLHEVPKITKEIEALAGDTPSGTGTGGMITKIQAAKIASDSGIACHIVNGGTERVLLKLMDGEKIGTFFHPCKGCRGARKRWIAHTSKKKGSIVVDNGAREALMKRNKSLLPSGIVRLEGVFHSGDAVDICDESGKAFARGLVNYTSNEIDKIKGEKTNRIEKILGHKAYDEVIHKDNLVLL